MTPTPQQKLLIVGSTGMLGSDLFQRAQQHYRREDIEPITSKDLDITDASQVFAYFEKVRPKIVLNAAAYTNVDLAETEKEKCYRVNALGPKNLTDACREFGSTFVHFTTDYIYSGEPDKIWTEEDLPQPQKPNHYAETKLAGETFARDYERSLILRVQWLYGTKKDRFSPLKEKKLFTPFIDQVGAPTWTREIAKAVFDLLQRDIRGIFNFAYDDYAIWFEVYQFVKERWNLNLDLQPKKTLDVVLPARRPLNCRMSNKKLCAALGIKSMGSWKKPFAEFLDLVQ